MNALTSQIQPPATDLFPVVGIGSSLGGLDAFRRLIKAIPEQPGMAFILVQHLEPSHESLLPDLLQKVTSIPVQEITNNVRVEVNRIYIIPSNKLLTAVDGHLQLEPRLQRSEPNMPIDLFFTSLAEVYQSQAIGVVLSGNATDGTLGLGAIKEQGGFTFAQEPASAAAKGMPESAIEAEVVDFILAPEAIPAELARLVAAFKNDLADDTPEVKLAREEAFRELLYLLRARTEMDFTFYKQTTVRRRILRRMGLNKMGSITEYLAFFRTNLPEQDLLYQDLLIPVTGFFRDPKVFDFLSDSVFPSLLLHRERELRIWVAGCSTGEEAYSMAIGLHELLGDKAADTRIRIFASDLSEKAIVKARSGLYSRRDIGGLSPARLQHYFTKVTGGFLVNKVIRDSCVFACHNFLKDPPFARMDLVSCRNVLIYMDAFLQKRALTTFHYALNESGFLLLGNSESAAPAGELFTIMGKQEKLFTRKPVRGRYLHIAAPRKEGSPGGLAYDAKKEPARDDFQKSADEILLSGYTPPGVVVNEHMEIVQFRGATGAWLEPSPGKPSLNVLKMAREGLAFELRNILHKAKTSNRAELKEHVPVRSLDKQRWVTVEVVPLPNMTEEHYLILFREETAARAGNGLPEEGAARGGETLRSQDGLRVEQLEKELAQLREDMRSITEEQEAANEELQSANEELLSGSEELQSLNEELETSKEEIQSTNEELTTLNEELSDRNAQLNLSRLYAESIVATVREPLLVLDKDLKVKTANPAWYKKFGASVEDTEGKSFFLLGKGEWDIPDLRRLLKDVLLKGGTISDFELRHSFAETGERILLLNASRIAYKDEPELMVLLAIEDVTEIKDREQNLENKVEERTSSLLQANLSLKHSNDSLEQYATIASHDLQEPLRKIRTFANILIQRHAEAIDGEPKELLQKISVSAERMSVLIRDVLNFAKVLDESIFEDTNLQDILNNVLTDYDLLIEQKKATVSFDPLPVIKAVSLQMNQLFYNLLGNALKFARPDLPPVIHISARVLEESAGLRTKGPFLELLVTDNGIGFDQRFADQVFLVFQRLNSREHFEGTGIGLALCRQIVLNHGGQITAESKKGMGAQFRILLPMK